MVCSKNISAGLIAFSMFLWAADVSAQQNKNVLPDISVPMDQQQQQYMLNPQNFTEYEIQNRYLNTTINLQHQIALIEKLARWQEQVNDIKTSYAAMGVSYDFAMPPQQICAQIPINIPCYRAYPDLYPGLAARIEAMTPKPAFEISAPIINDIKDEKANNVEEASFEPTFHWVEVYCMSGVCTAVLSYIDDAESRLNAKVGDLLPDGSKLSRVQPTAVAVTHDGETYRLRPAPLKSDKFTSKSKILNVDKRSAAEEKLLQAFPGKQESLPLDQENSTSLDDVDDLPDLPGLGETGLF